jgi:hypothetical protein
MLLCAGESNDVVHALAEWSSGIVSASGVVCHEIESRQGIAMLFILFRLFYKRNQFTRHSRK